MEESPLDTLNEPQEIQPKKSKNTFLRVISIISIGFAAWGLLNGAVGLIGNNFEAMTPDEVSEMPNFSELEDAPDLGDMVMINPDVDYAIIAEYNYLESWISLGAGLLTIIFVIGMMRLKKAAFYPYVVTKLLQIGIPIYLLSGVDSGSFTMIIMFWTVVGFGLNQLVFVFMFSRNLKHMS